jgi:hypothetical protein
MRPPKTTAERVCLWFSRLLLPVRASFDFVGASERLSRTGTTHRRRTPSVHGLEWEAYMACCSGFLL